MRTLVARGRRAPPQRERRREKEEEGGRGGPLFLFFSLSSYLVGTSARVRITGFLHPPGDKTRQGKTFPVGNLYSRFGEGAHLEMIEIQAESIGILEFTVATR